MRREVNVISHQLKLAIFLLLLSYGFDALLQSVLYFYLTLEMMYYMHWVSLGFSFFYSIAVLWLASRKGD